MDSVISQVKKLAQDADEATRKKILNDLRDLALYLETPQDTMQRISYLHLQPPLVRIGLDLKIFDILAESDHPLTVKDLAAKTNAAPTLLGEFPSTIMLFLKLDLWRNLKFIFLTLEIIARILRYLASVGTIKEIDVNTFFGNNVTNYLSDEGIGSAVYHNVNTVAPAIFALPDFLAKNKYQDITSPVNTPLQQAFNTDLPAFVWAQTQPDRIFHFSKFMEADQRGISQWFEVYPIEKRSENLKPDQALFVDVGGNIGHQSVELKHRLPHIKNDIILQDSEIVLANAIPCDGVKPMVFDFFQPQVLKGDHRPSLFWVTARESTISERFYTIGPMKMPSKF
ncbi:hypothetical protein N7462_010362 [Penicillium macrosclerotiorum]|uniref:uncharacterized protein n=1 Tax=Penicillium macrosclerotiorum TaxID=303699 RepID=UPI0025468D53|nr:uncharacterized protein N7462_010362 [Penicillium macrosclerotiorum]KAJ5669292.1 hypothetical protein N7462_010362 [Penicillium macrosclerotiorum]